MTEVIEATGIATQPKEKPTPIAIGNGGLKFTNSEELFRWAGALSKSGMVPKDYIDRPQAILAAVQLGSELGFSPMQALQSIAVIQGRPTVWGDGLVAIALASGLCEDMSVHIEGEGDAMFAVAEVKRKGIATPFVSTFTVAHAKKAGLWGKSGPWSSYPERMLCQRARAFAIRDALADMLRGIGVREEIADYPPEAKPVEAAKTFSLDVE
jgi:hypothetical protein